MATTGSVGIGTTPSASVTDKLTVAGNIVPSDTNLYSLGTSGNVWRDVYVGNNSLHIGGTALSNVGGALNWNNLPLNIWSLNGALAYYNDGNVGIGTNAPAAKLHVVAPEIRLQDANRGRFRVFDIGGGNLAYSVRTATGGGWSWQLVDGNDHPYFHVSYPSGNVGIGTSEPEEKLHIGTGNLLMENANQVWWKDTVGTKKQFQWVTANRMLNRSIGDGFESQNAAGGIGMRIKDNGTVGIGVTDPLSSLVLPNGGTLAWKASGSSGAEITAIKSNSDKLEFTTNGLSRVVIDNTGNVGIGTTSPSTNAEVFDDVYHSPTSIDGTITLSQPTVSSTGSPAIRFKQNTGGGIGSKITGITHNGGGDLVVSTTNSWGSMYERLRINAAGNVGIGTTNPGGLLGLGNSSTYLGVSGNNLTFTDSVTGTKTLAELVGGGGGLWSIATGGIHYSTGKVGIGTTSPWAKLAVVGAANISNGTGHATQNNFMTSGSLTIGAMDSNYGGGSLWNTNTAGLLLETLDNTEIAVHDAGHRIASLMHYEGGLTKNQITIGRNMGWGPISKVSIHGNVGIGTATPNQKLEVNGNIAAGHRWGNNGDSASNTADVNIGKLDAAGAWNDGSAYIRFKDNANDGTVNAGTSIAFHSHKWGGGTREAMRITGSRNVGIGTVNPIAKLSIDGGNININHSFPYMRFERDGGEHGYVGNGFALFDADASKPDFGIRAENNLLFGISSSEKMRIIANGNVGIGTTSPAALLTLNQNAGTDVGGIRLVDGAVTWSMYGDAEGDFHLKGGGTAIGEVVIDGGTGNVGIGTPTPGAKLEVVGDLKVTGSLTTSYSASSDIMSSTTNTGATDTDVSVTFTADGSSKYLLMMSADVGNSVYNSITHVYLSRGSTNLSSSRQRLRDAEAAPNENVALTVIDVPPSGTVTYKIRLSREGAGTAYMFTKRLSIVKL